MSTFTWGPGEQEICEAIADLSSWYGVNRDASVALAEAITGTGKSVDDLTVGELRDICRRVRAPFLGAPA